MRNLTIQGCKSSPPLINWKREEQNGNGHVPGGFIVYLVTEELPGKRLSRDAYWNLSSKERNEIRDAFKVAFMYVTRYLVAHIIDLFGLSLTIFGL